MDTFSAALPDAVNGVDAAGTRTGVRPACALALIVAMVAFPAGAAPPPPAGPPSKESAPAAVPAKPAAQPGQTPVKPTPTPPPSPADSPPKAPPSPPADVPAAPTPAPTTATPPAPPAQVPNPPSTAPASAGPAAAPAAPDKPRVHLIIDRRTEVGGFLDRETDSEIVLLWKGEPLIFPKARLLEIVRLVEPRPGQMGTLYLRDGSALDGVVLQDGFEEVVLEIAGIRTKYPRREVDHVELAPSFEDQYEQFQKTIARNDWTRRMDFAVWLVDNKRYALARQELVPIVEQGDIEGAHELLRLVEAQLRLDGVMTSESSTASDPPRKEGWEREPGQRAGRVDLRDMLPERILTHEDVNVIRVYEMDLRNPPRLSVSPETIRAMIEQHGSSDLIPADSASRTALFRAEPLEIVSLLFKLKARDLYPRIEVESEPSHLNLFRQRVHNAWLIPNCATSRCHGGLDAGSFFLYSRNYKDERVRFTNLLILDQSTFDGKPLIDYDDPMSSLLIQYALPKTEARFPHPPVKGWRPVFQEANQRLLQDTIAWIKAMYLPRPKYPVEFEMPKLDSPDHAPVEPSDLPRER